jgi:Zn-dependent protease
MPSLLQQILFLILPILGAITVHEYAHALSAFKLGDPTPKYFGRLSLNPIKHLDPIGTLVLFLTKTVGWARPVPINPFNFRDPRKGMLLVALSGPMANVIFGLLCAFLYRGLKPLSLGFFDPLLVMLKLSVGLNLGIALFNLIPIPPLDGSKILYGILPKRKDYLLFKLERYGFLILLVLVLSGLIGGVLYPLIQASVKFLIGESL